MTWDFCAYLSEATMRIGLCTHCGTSCEMITGCDPDDTTVIHSRCCHAIVHFEEFDKTVDASDRPKPPRHEPTLH